MNVRGVELVENHESPWPWFSGDADGFSFVVQHKTVTSGGDGGWWFSVTSAMGFRYGNRCDDPEDGCRKIEMQMDTWRRQMRNFLGLNDGA